MANSFTYQFSDGCVLVSTGLMADAFMYQPICLAGKWRIDSLSISAYVSTRSVAGASIYQSGLWRIHSCINQPGQCIHLVISSAISYQRIWWPPPSPPRCRKCENSGKFRKNQGTSEPLKEGSQPIHSYIFRPPSLPRNSRIFTFLTFFWEGRGGSSELW